MNKSTEKKALIVGGLAVGGFILLSRKASASTPGFITAPSGSEPVTTTLDSLIGAARVSNPTINFGNPAIYANAAQAAAAWQTSYGMNRAFNNMNDLQTVNSLIAQAASTIRAFPGVTAIQSFATALTEFGQWVSTNFSTDALGNLGAVLAGLGKIVPGLGQVLGTVPGFGSLMSSLGNVVNSAVAFKLPSEGAVTAALDPATQALNQQTAALLSDQARAGSNMLQTSPGGPAPVPTAELVLANPEMFTPGYNYQTTFGATVSAATPSGLSNAVEAANSAAMYAQAGYAAQIAAANAQLAAAGVGPASLLSSGGNAAASTAAFASGVSTSMENAVHDSLAALGAMNTAATASERMREMGDMGLQAMRNAVLAERSPEAGRQAGYKAWFRLYTGGQFSDAELFTDGLVNSGPWYRAWKASIDQYRQVDPLTNRLTDWPSKMITFPDGIVAPLEYLGPHFSNGYVFIGSPPRMTDVVYSWSRQGYFVPQQALEEFVDELMQTLIAEAPKLDVTVEDYLAALPELNAILRDRAVPAAGLMTAGGGAFGGWTESLMENPDSPNYNPSQIQQWSVDNSSGIFPSWNEYAHAYQDAISPIHYSDRIMQAYDQGTKMLEYLERMTGQTFA